MLTYGKVKADYTPLSYALVFSLCASVLFLAAHNEFGYWTGEELIRPEFINVVLAGGLVTLIAWAAGSLKKLKSKPLAIASVGVLLFGLISAPGIILAIGLMILGYAKHEKLLIISGVLLMPVFIFLYYYNLDIFLMQKSGVLVSSGFALILGRLYLQSQRWDKEVVPCA